MCFLLLFVYVQEILFLFLHYGVVDSVSLKFMQLCCVLEFWFNFCYIGSAIILKKYLSLKKYFLAVFLDFFAWKYLFSVLILILSA